MDADDGRTLAIVLGTVGGLLVILIVIFVACYVARRWPWLAVDRRTRILRAEMALDGDRDSVTDIRPASLRNFARRGMLRTKPSTQLPSAPEQSVVDLTELDEVRDQPTLV